MNVPPKNGLTAYFTKEIFHKYIPEETFHTKLLKQLEGFDALPKTQFTSVPEVKRKEKAKKEKKKDKTEFEIEETHILEEISQNEADKSVSENGNNLDNRLNPSIMPTTGNDFKSGNDKSKQKAKQNESSTAFSGILSSLPGSRRRYQSQSSQHHPNKKSCLSQQEQRSYIDLFDKYGSHIPVDPTEEERTELRRFTALKSKVSHEQAEFQAYLKKLSQKCMADYKFMLPSAKRYIQDKIQNGKKEVEKYPRHYSMVESVSLMVDSAELQSAVRLNYVSPLLCLGQVPKVQLPNMSMGIHPFVSTDFEKIQERFPTHLDKSDSNCTWNHEPCSKDSNAEFLAVRHGCQVVMSSSALSCLVDNQDSQHDCLWELPVHIKEHESVVNGQIVKHNVIYFDKPVQQSSLTIREKSTWFHKYGLKMLVLSSVQKGQIFSNPLQPSKGQKGQTTLKEAQGQGSSKCDLGRKDDFVQQPDSGKKDKGKESDEQGKPISDFSDPFGIDGQNMEELETFGASAFSPRRRSSKKYDLGDRYPLAVKEEDKTDDEIRKKDKPGSSSGEFFCSEAVDIDSLETFGAIKTFSGDISKVTNLESDKESAGEVMRTHAFQNSETIKIRSEENEEKDSKVELVQQSAKPESHGESFSSVSSASISPTENKFQTDASRSAFSSVPTKQSAEMQEEQAVKEEGKEIKDDIKKEIIFKDSDLNLSTEDSDEDKLVIAYDCHEESNLENQSSSGSHRRLTRSASKQYVQVFGDYFMVDTPQSPVMLTPQIPTMETPESPQKDSFVSPVGGGGQRVTCKVIPLDRQSEIRSVSKPYVPVFGDHFMVDTPQSPAGDSPSSPIMLTPQSPTMETPESPQKDSFVSPVGGGGQRVTCKVIPLERQSEIRPASKSYVQVFGDHFMVDTPQSPAGDSPSSPVMLTPQSPTMETPESPQKDSFVSPVGGGEQRVTCKVIPLEHQSDTDTGDETVDGIGNAKKRQKISHIFCDHSDFGKNFAGTSFISDYSLRPLKRWQSPRRQQSIQLSNKDNISAIPVHSNANSDTLACAGVTATIASRIGRHRIAHQKSMKQDSKEGSDVANKQEKKNYVEPPALSDYIQASPRVLRSATRKSDSSESQPALVENVRKSARKRVTRTNMDNLHLSPGGHLNVTTDSVMEEKPAERAIELVSKEDVLPPKRKRGRPSKRKVVPVDMEKDNKTNTIPLSVIHVPSAITSLVCGQNKVQTTTLPNVQPVVSAVTSGQKVTLPAYGDNKGQPVFFQEKKSDKIYMKKDQKQGIMKAEASNASPLDAILNLQQKMLGVPSDGLHASTSAIPTDETGNFKHPRNHNVTYHLWTLGTIRVLIRCGYHGILREPQYSQFHYVHICPKLEYQLSFGLEQSSVSEVAKNWISLYIRPNSQLLRARINAFTSEVAFLEELDIQRVIPLTSSFKPAQAFLLLQRLLCVLLKCPVGQYLIVHTPGEPNCKILKSTEGNKRGSYDLHFKHLGFMTDTASSSADPVQWNPIDTSLFLPQHRHKGRIPATYTPQGFTSEKFKSKKKNKGKRKQKKKK
ncbi:hypothetical protein CHS0354_043065 [Potamilus streckersoni]|uniref:Little elongation complex subunit 2 C-terminal domain-containing protein n=1 Tax=Potamilus streckersoni TaxID=2493646 RepID=A0AAE0VTI9_9BIVA|nr:hypothetical protein CHS0354_043065 [Potamilus streckersoni]